MTENDLQMSQHLDVVLITVFSLVKRGFVIQLLLITEHIIPGFPVTLQHSTRHT